MGTPVIDQEQAFKAYYKDIAPMGGPVTIPRLTPDEMIGDDEPEPFSRSEVIKHMINYASQEVRFALNRIQ